VWGSLSGSYLVDNGTPQGYVYAQVQTDFGRSLIADDGALWKWGRNVPYIVRKLQEAIDEVEQWGFRFSVLRKLRQCSLPGGRCEMRYA
jgi:hypothetical protein